MDIRKVKIELICRGNAMETDLIGSAKRREVDVHRLIIYLIRFYNRGERDRIIANGKHLETLKIGG